MLGLELPRKKVGVLSAFRSKYGCDQREPFIVALMGFRACVRPSVRSFVRPFVRPSVRILIILVIFGQNTLKNNVFWQFLQFLT